MKTFLALLLAAGSLYAANPPIDSLIAAGNEAFYNLDYDQAIAAYEKAVAANPDNPAYHNFVAQSLLYREMFRDGALESELVSGNNSFSAPPEDWSLPPMSRSASSPRSTGPCRSARRASRKIRGIRWRCTR